MVLKYNRKSDMEKDKDHCWSFILLKSFDIRFVFALCLKVKELLVSYVLWNKSMDWLYTGLIF